MLKQKFFKDENDIQKKKLTKRRLFDDGENESKDKGGNESKEKNVAYKSPKSEVKTRAQRVLENEPLTEWDEKMFNDPGLHLVTPGQVARNICVNSKEIYYSVDIELYSSAQKISKEEEIKSEDYLPGCTKVGDKQMTPTKHNVMDTVIIIQFEKNKQEGRGTVYSKERPSTSLSPESQKINSKADELFKLACTIPEIKKSYEQLQLELKEIKLHPNASYDADSDMLKKMENFQNIPSVPKKNIKTSGIVIDSMILRERSSGASKGRSQTGIMKISATPYTKESGVKPFKILDKDQFVWGHLSPYSFGKRFVRKEEVFKNWLQKQDVKPEQFIKIQSAKNLASITLSANRMDSLIENLARFICTYYAERLGWWVEQELLSEKHIGTTKKIIIYLPEKNIKFTFEHNCLRLEKYYYSAFKYMLYVVDKVLNTDFTCQPEVKSANDEQKAGKMEVELPQKDILPSPRASIK